MKGYIYVLTNPAMPGLVKIGRSIHGGRKRAEQLDCTAVPLPFEVFFEMTFADIEEAELAIHEAVAAHRINRSREFFSIAPEVAAKTVMAEWLRSESYSIVDDYDCYVLQMVQKIATTFNGSVTEVVNAFMSEIDPAAIELALERVRDRAAASRERTEAMGL